MNECIANYYAARFNLGLAFHQQRDWGQAITAFQEVLYNGKFQMVCHIPTPSINWYGLVTDEVNEALQWEARVYLCDLLEALELLEEAIECWEAGVRIYPDSGLMYNELGKLQLQVLPKASTIAIC